MQHYLIAATRNSQSLTAQAQNCPGLSSSSVGVRPHFLSDVLGVRHRGRRYTLQLCYLHANTTARSSWLANPIKVNIYLPTTLPNLRKGGTPLPCRIHVPRGNERTPRTDQMRMNSKKRTQQKTGAVTVLEVVG